MYSETVGISWRWFGAVSTGIVLGLIALVSASCAAIDGLDGFSTGGCAGSDCDGGADREIVLRGTTDALAEAAVSGDDGAAAGDATEATDATSDDSDTGTTSEPDADAAAGAPDTGGGQPEAGCGLGTPASCSACGVSCNTSTGAPSCNGTTCSYACNAGRQDCNASKAPDTDGCECAGNGCCSGKCQTSHANGKGNNFYDCNATGTHNQGQAAEACAALAGSTSCSSSNAPCNCILFICGAQAQSVCASSGGKCYCWQYSGPNAGTVQESSGSSCSASCGSSSDPTWN